MTQRPAILDRLRGVRRAGRGWCALCPAHDDERQSLSVGVGDDGRTLVNCHAAKCPPEKITTAVGMTLADLAPPTARTNGSASRSERRIVATYDYTDAAGVVLYQNVRYEPKDFRQRRPDGRGGWIWNMDVVRRAPYRLVELAEAPRVYICEGEKDCDALAAIELRATTNEAGAGKWRGEHTQALVGAAVPEAVILPDNDRAGEAHALDVARSCLTAGLRVKIVRLPALPDKGDVSDFLAEQRAGGRTDDEIRAAIEALADAAPVFSPTTAPEPAAETAINSPEPELRREGMDLALAWPDGIVFSLAAVRGSREGVRGDLTVTRNGRRLSWGSFALSSTSARETLRKKLEATASGPPWGAYLEETAFRLTQAARAGEPIVTLSGAVTSPTRELMPRLLYEGEPTLVFADGDTGKSLLAVALAVAVQSGTALPFGLKPSRTVAAALLDWETGRDTTEMRLGLVAAGLGVDPPPILYKRMTRPLVDEAEALAVEFARRGIGFVVIDSMMFAVAGGDGAAFHEPITGFYNALRLFAPAASLVLSHVTGADARGGGPARPFGGAFAFNGPRLIWEAKRDHDVEDATAIAFTCRKANNLPRKPEPFGLRFVPSADAITIFPLDLRDAAPSTVAGASLPYRVRLALASGAMTTPEIAEALGISDASARTVLRRLASKGTVANLGTATDGKATRWELIAR